jgi:predicted nucleotidyltransferase component of viral defense system
MFSQIYLDQVRLLLDILPVINQQECFALKGGTAINLFLTNMPRLSVDIDLTYLPVEPREVFLENITQALQVLEANILAMNRRKYKVSRVLFKNSKQVSKLLVKNNDCVIKIEPNFVLRGNVFPCEIGNLCESAKNDFLMDIKIKMLSSADIYAGKICAALSRQHPRDLFDVKFLLEETGITDEIRQAFVVYLASSPRPMNEILSPNLYPDEIQSVFERDFDGMTQIQVTCDELIDVRKSLQEIILKDLTNDERHFLISIKEMTPNWGLLPISGIENLPGIQWKLMNVKKMPREKHREALQSLKKLLL